MIKKLFIIMLLLFITADCLAYTFKAKVQKKKENDVVVGLVIKVLCTGSERTSSTSWYVAKKDLDPWPPTKESLLVYIKIYLRQMITEPHEPELNEILINRLKRLSDIPIKMITHEIDTTIPKDKEINP